MDWSFFYGAENWGNVFLAVPFVAAAAAVILAGIITVARGD